MGDVLTLVERAQETFDEKQAEEMARKLQRNAFTLEDFLSQMQQLKKMGPIGGLLEMIPGMGGAAKEAQQAVDRGDLKRVEAIIQSMTLEERRDPDILSGSRKRRIARGSGTNVGEVNRLIEAVRRDAQADEADERLGRAAGGDAAARAALSALFRGALTTGTTYSSHGRDTPKKWDDEHMTSQRGGDPSGPPVFPSVGGDSPASRRADSRHPHHRLRPSWPSQLRLRRVPRQQAAAALVGRLAAIATIVVIALLGGMVAVLGARPATPSLVAQYAPADAAAYVEIRYDLPGDQADKLAEFMSHFPGFADQAAFRAEARRDARQCARAERHWARLGHGRRAMVRRPDRRFHVDSCPNCRHTAVVHGGPVGVRTSRSSMRSSRATRQATPTCTRRTTTGRRCGPARS